MNILFHSKQICERGTEVALFDYAMENIRVLHNASFIAVPLSGVQDRAVLDAFQQYFEVCLYQSQNELTSFAAAKNIDLIYIIIDGSRDEDIEIHNVPRFVHCVFFTNHKQGTFYCPISHFINKWCKTKYPVLPHIVKKFRGNIDSLRSELQIPENAVVFGGYGGELSFGIKFAQEAVCEVARNRSDIYFIFLNFRSFIPAGEIYRNIVFLPKNTDRDYKETFINTCDAMLHARPDGETFGLAIAEFSVKNKPVITFAPDLTHNTKYCVREFLRYLCGDTYRYATAHLDFLGKKAIRYTSKKDLTQILCNFKEKYLKPINYDCYSEQFSEEKVMKIFERIIRGTKELEIT